MTTKALTEHQLNWWGEQKCRNCNPEGKEKHVFDSVFKCPDCNSTGWTEWAALAHEPYTKITDDIYVGGCNYADGEGITLDHHVSRGDPFESVISMYADAHMYGPYKPDGMTHYMFPFNDGGMNQSVIELAYRAAKAVDTEVRQGNKVLVRCQAGLNRSNLVAGIYLIAYRRMNPKTVVDLLRKRSPWVLCNDDFEAFLLNEVGVGAIV